MRIKEFIGYTFFLLLTYGLYFYYNENNLPERWTILYFSTGTFSLINISISIYHLRNEKKYNSILKLLTGLLIFQIALKADYTYYNKFIAYILLSLSIFYILVEQENVERLTLEFKRFLIFIVIITFITISIPDRVILNYINRDDKIWSSNIEFYDFEGRKNDSTDHIAVSINSGIKWKANLAFDYPSAVVIGTMNTKRSWINEYWKVKSSDDYILKHEQTHFDITEYHSRLARDSISKHLFLNENEVESIILSFHFDSKVTHNIYDSLTKHGTLDDVQTFWTRKYREMLKY